MAPLAGRGVRHGAMRLTLAAGAAARAASKGSKNLKKSTPVSNEVKNERFLSRKEKFKTQNFGEF